MGFSLFATSGLGVQQVNSVSAEARPIFGACAGAAVAASPPAQDAKGNRIPSRTEVKPGTKGSREFVAARQGKAWAARMEGLT